ncbi:protein-L-isoaspartate(D-aspartate) O-methyltransferase [candidate division KSB1 bacterium]
MKTLNFPAIRNVAILIFIFLTQCIAQDKQDADYTRQRKLMVKIQIESRGISNEDVLDAMLKVERHLFVPEEYQSLAYEDHPLPIGEGQTISQPYIVALMTEILGLNRDEKVLEIGTGSGYQAAILGELCDSVFTIEINKNLGERALKLLAEQGYKNIFGKIGDGYQGWDQYAAFDAIMVTCSPSHIPEPLKDQLAEGGKMIIPLGGTYVQELVLLTKKNGVISETDIIPVRFVPMINFEGKEY